MEAAVEIRELTHRYGERTALDGVSFEVAPGEIFGLLGPNGGGKTTLFRILSTLFPPTSGAARVFGREVVSDSHEVRRRIGVVFQSPSLDKKLTVRENLLHQGHLYGMSGKDLETRISELLDRVGMADRSGELVETLSGGMQRRVEVAKGLLHRPQLLILDEPSTGLDPGGRIDLWTYLKRLREREGVTILLTTHLMDEGERCDRLCILSRGKVVAIGTPEDLRREVGGDVVTFQPADPEELRDWLRSRMSAESSVFDGQVRLEREDGHELVRKVVEEFPGEIRSMTVGRPTLEDVFIRKTGHRFWEEEGVIA